MKAREEIRYAIGESSLGKVLVAHSDLGVAAVLLGDDRAELERDLERRFPNASLIDADAEVDALARRVIKHVEAPRRALNVPLDMRGTAFQRTVWNALRDIPAGATANYSEIALRIGMPSAVRAVAQACASNALAVVVPCHRVVKADGKLSGYRWGVERKRLLLERERVA